VGTVLPKDEKVSLPALGLHWNFLVTSLEEETEENRSEKAGEGAALEGEGGRKGGLSLPASQLQRELSPFI
jgi:hypothetical protein